MNKLFLISISAFVFIVSACGNKPTPQGETTDEASISGENANMNKTDLLLGNWINAGYHKALLENLSPYKSLKLINDYSEMTITGHTVELVHNNSESESLTYQKVPSEKLSLDLSNGLNITYIDANKIQLIDKKIKENFIRVEKPGEGRSSIDQFVMSRLIAGVYNSRIGKVEFSENGSIKGLENYSFYKVYTVFEELSDFDIMEFRDTNGKANFKAWEIKNDELILYNIQPGTAYLFEKGDEWMRLKLIEAIG